MKKKLSVFTFSALVFGLFLIQAAQAHTPLCSCYDNGDGSVTCEGGFSDGSSAAGVQMRVEDAAGKVLNSGTMNDDSEFTFDKPAGDYKVQFDAGEGHKITVDGKEISQ
nr:RodZ domain-containing protein [uncultured Desulfobacter sp.]